MLVIAAGLFFESGRTDVDTIEGAHAGFEALIGGGAALAFAVALLASGLSSSSVGTYAGQVVMQGFINYRIKLFVRRAITMAPALVVLALGLNPTDTLVISQVVLSFGIPFALVPMILLTRRKDIMGSFVNRPVTTAIAVSGRGADHRAEPLPAPADLLRLSAPQAAAEATPRRSAAACKRRSRVQSCVSLVSRAPASSCAST